MERTQCMACNDETKNLVWCGSVLLCRLCAHGTNVQQALAIVRHRHHERLADILAALDAEPSR